MKLFAKGSRVTQVTYGAGTVTSSDERYTVIEFDQHGRRVFLTDMVALAKTDEPAPNKPAKEKRKKAAKTSRRRPSSPRLRRLGRSVGRLIPPETSMSFPRHSITVCILLALTVAVTHTVAARQSVGRACRHPGPGPRASSSARRHAQAVGGSQRPGPRLWRALSCRLISDGRSAVRRSGCRLSCLARLEAPRRMMRAGSASRTWPPASS